MSETQFELSYDGNFATEHQLDFYDASVALVGFQRSLAITTHAVLNGEVITQAPALKGARILALPPEAGSWKIKAMVITGIGSALYAIGTAPRDTPLGNLVSSAYDYVVSDTLGFHVDYDSTLGQQYESARAAEGALPELTKSRLEGVVEKCEVAIRDMHRPIVRSETASAANISKISRTRSESVGYPLTKQTYDLMLEGRPMRNNMFFAGRVSGYNMNTFKGRVFLGEARRPIPFEIADNARTPEVIVAIARSLAANVRSRRSDDGLIEFSGIPLEARTGRLKSIVITGIGGGDA